MSKRLKTVILLFVNFFFLEGLVEAQQKISTNSDKKPIEITADNGIEWHKNEKKYIAIGNAKAKQGDLIVTSDKLEAYYSNSKKDEENSVRACVHGRRNSLCSSQCAQRCSSLF